MTVRWGVLGTGGIVPPVVAAIRAEGGDVVAIASADHGRAAARAAELAIGRSFGAHHDLLSMADGLDAVYLATTNDRHHADLLACIAAGVPVLAEKPFTLDLAQAVEVQRAARAGGVFVMEGMWMRFQPVFVELERRIAAGQIGEPVLAHVDFGIAAETNRAAAPCSTSGCTRSRS
jgi:predicted dehydrogenase